MKPNLQLPVMLERINRCEYCGSEMKITALAHKQNPFCSICYEERVLAVRPSLPAAIHRVGGYITFTRSGPQTPQ